MKFEQQVRQVHAEAVLWVVTVPSALPLILLHWLVLRYSEG